MEANDDTQDTHRPTLDDFRRLEAERDHLFRLLEAARKGADQGERDLAMSQGREEGSRVELWQQGVELQEATDTIDRQEGQMAGQRRSIERLKDERDASAGREAQLRRAVNERSLELEEKEMLLAWVMESSVDGVLVYRSVPDATGQVVDFECVLNNPAAERLYGVDRLTGKRLLELHADIHEAGLWSEYLKVMQTGEPYEGEYRYTADDQERWFRVLAIRVAGSLAVTFSDISQRKQMEADILRQVEELKQADRMKDEFLGVVSHELRTPINGIMGFISILEDEIAGPVNPAQHAYLEKASLSAERLLGLISNLLDLSRIQAGRFTVDPRPVAFAPIVAGVLDSLAAVAGSRIVTNEVPADLPAVMADETRLVQVLTIVVGNAIKFSAAADSVRVRAGVEAGVLRCEVKDTGMGIAEADLPKLFKAFSQVDMSSTRDQGGAGLGLTLARSLIDAHGGQIGVESHQGEGSTFWFTLPLAGDPQGAT